MSTAASALPNTAHQAETLSVKLALRSTTFSVGSQEGFGSIRNVALYMISVHQHIFIRRYLNNGATFKFMTSGSILFSSFVDAEVGACTFVARASGKMGLETNNQCGEPLHLESSCSLAHQESIELPRGWAHHETSFVYILPILLLELQLHGYTRCLSPLYGFAMLVMARYARIKIRSPGVTRVQNLRNCSETIATTATTSTLPRLIMRIFMRISMDT